MTVLKCEDLSPLPPPTRPHTLHLPLPFNPQVLARHVLPRPGTAAKAFPLREYADAGLSQLRVFLRKERTPVRGGGGVCWWEAARLWSVAAC